MAKQKIKIGIIGAGSIGSLFGGYLASIDSQIYDIEMTFFCRKGNMEVINEKGLKIIKGDETLAIKKIKAFSGPENFKNGFDFCIISTKTHGLEKTLREFMRLLKDSKRVVILQNGIGNAEVVSQACNKEKIIRVITSNGALLDGPGRIIHTGDGFTKIGYSFQGYINKDYQKMASAQEDLVLLKALLNLGGIITTIADDINMECWGKVFINVGINPFGALTRLENGLLLENESLKKMMAGAVGEAVGVAIAGGVKLKEENHVSLMFDVAEKTSKNRNSMLQDILKGKQTEIDFINGKIVTLARELEISVPINELLTSLIHGLEMTFKKFKN